MGNLHFKRARGAIMKKHIISLMILSLMSLEAQAQGKVRRVNVHGDQIVTVKTSLGIATIIQVPDRPNSVVVGDQNAFKVEYLDQAITIKPVASGVKSNLYIYTDWKRFNVELVSGSEAVADYVVYLENPKTAPKTSLEGTGVIWTKASNYLRNEAIELSTKKLGRSGKDALLVEFIVTSKKKEKLLPEWLWLKQGEETVPIHNLVLSGLEISPGMLISGVLQIRAKDLNLNEPFRLELRRKKISYLTIQKASSWKR
jgi:hypothetical protein